MVGRESFIAVYLLASRRNGTVYAGVTSRLFSRVRNHRDEVFGGFTAKYSVKRLVWYERFETMAHAIQREKSIKRWPREWKLNLIERDNPHWDDLYDQMMNWTPIKPQFDDWPSSFPPQPPSS